MKIEFRSSGEKACETCGATELIRTSRGESLAHDLGAFITQQTSLVEAALLAQFKEERMSLEQVVKDEQRRVKEQMEAAHAEYEKAVNETIGKRASRFRMFKRRWQSQVDAEVDRVTLELRDKTARV